MRRATRRELRVLEDLLVASLEHESDLGAAIAEHRESATRGAAAELRAVVEGRFEGRVVVARLGERGGRRQSASPGR